MPRRRPRGACLDPQSSTAGPRDTGFGLVASMAIVYLAVSVVLRLPYFFAAVIQWDEGIFILMG
jgi:hypothetical protein